MKESQSKNKGELSIEEFFALPKIRGYIEIAHIVSEQEPNHIDLVYHFSMGLFLSHCDKDYFKNDIEECLTPVFNLLIKWVKSEKYRKPLLEEVIPGDETVPGTQVPVSVNGLLKFMNNFKNYTGKELGIPLKSDDIFPIVTEFIQVKKKQFADVKPTGKIKKKQETNYSDELYALADLILVVSKSPLAGKPENTESKNSVIDYGRKRYGIAGRVFYNSYRSLRLNDIAIAVRITNKSENGSNWKYRHNWKEIVKQITGNDADVILWLNKAPN